MMIIKVARVVGCHSKVQWFNATSNCTYSGKCLVTPLQLPVKQTQNINTNRHTFNKPFKCHCCRIFSSADNFKNSDNKTTRKCKSLKQYFFPIENGCASKPKDKNLTTIQSDLFKQLNAFYRFSRPHTVIGTALVPSILMNLYVVGINQLFDVDIDKVNKPNLPLASGEFSMEFGMAMVSTYLLMSFTMGIMFQPLPLFSALLVSFLLGSAYSVELPLLRWKRNAFLAAICILIVRAIIIQLAFFIHIQDIPDVFWLCISMLLIAYGAAMVIGASSSFLTTKLVTVLGHCALASCSMPSIFLFLLYVEASEGTPKVGVDALWFHQICD
ncbi:unnamed protein product [Camellia sinensis]